MPEVRGPPRLRVRHQLLQVILECLVVEALELLGVVEVGAHGVRLRRMRVQELERQLVGPPVAVRHRATGPIERTFSAVSHWLLLRVLYSDDTECKRERARERY